MGELACLRLLCVVYLLLIGWLLYVDSRPRR